VSTPSHGVTPYMGRAAIYPFLSVSWVVVPLLLQVVDGRAPYTPQLTALPPCRECPGPRFAANGQVPSISLVVEPDPLCSE